MLRHILLTFRLTLYANKGLETQEWLSLFNFNLLKRHNSCFIFAKEVPRHNIVMCLMFFRVFQCGAEGQRLQRIQEDGQHTLHPHCRSKDIRSVNATHSWLPQLCFSRQLVNKWHVDANARNALIVTLVVFNNCTWLLLTLVLWQHHLWSEMWCSVQMSLLETLSHDIKEQTVAAFYRLQPENRGHIMRVSRGSACSSSH